jgi:hypothetical protein
MSHVWVDQAALQPEKDGPGPAAIAAGPAPPVFRFILRRLALGLDHLWVLSLLIFFGTHILPGNPGRRCWCRSRRRGGRAA